MGCETKTLNDILQGNVNIDASHYIIKIGNYSKYPMVFMTMVFITCKCNILKKYLDICNIWVYLYIVWVFHWNTLIDGLIHCTAVSAGDHSLWQQNITGYRKSIITQNLWHFDKNKKLLKADMISFCCIFKKTCYFGCMVHTDAVFAQIVSGNF